MADSETPIKMTTLSNLSEENKIHPVVWKCMLLICVLVYGSYSIFIHLCEVDGKLPFSSFSVILLEEFSKLCICIGFLSPQIFSGTIEYPTIQQSLPFAIPAIIYCFNNNISVVMQLEMDPATYQVLGNLKIISTALLYKVIIKRHITYIQWFALFLLVCAGVSNSFGGFHSKGVEIDASVVHISIKGLVMMSIYCILSGVAGVYSEYILKKKKETSIHIQNGMLYTYGVILNGSMWVYSTSNSETGDWNLIKGFSMYTWVVVFSHAIIGLIMSAIMKHGNNITRMFVISCAMIVSTGLSMLIFKLQLNVFFCLAFAMVILALLLYHNVLSLDYLKTYFEKTKGVLKI